MTVGNIEMSQKRARSVAIPLAITVAVLLGLVLRLARFDEHVVVRITSPAGPYPLRLKGGTTCLVEGMADSGDATYQAVDRVDLEVVYRTGDAGKTTARSMSSTFDRSSGRFSGTITLPMAGKQKEYFLGALAIDRSGRDHGSNPETPDGSLIPILIE